MISIVACTNREEFVPNILLNVQKQTVEEKELILILNTFTMNQKKIDQLLEESALDSKLLHFPAEMSLGECLNKGISEAKHTYIAKMDDDDYYGAEYLAESLNLLRQTGADLVGKSSFYIYFKKNRELRLYNPNREHCWLVNDGQSTYTSSHFLSGATMVFKKELVQQAAFPHVNLGEDSGFQQLCFRKKLNMYSLSKEHYLYVRFETPGHHTSDATDHVLRRRSKLILNLSSLEECIAYLQKKAGN